MGGSRLSYVEGWRVISIANEVFGFDGWRSSIQTLNIDFMDAIEGGRFNVGASCVMRITLSDGSYREDVGYGTIENAKSKGQALEKVKKEASTDALKRAMRQFGNVLGNCLYDKEYVKNVTHVQKQPRGRIIGDTLYRYNDLEGCGVSSAGSGPAASPGAHVSAPAPARNGGANAPVTPTPSAAVHKAVNDANARGKWGFSASNGRAANLGHVFADAMRCAVQVRGIGNQSEDDMDFDLDGIDDASVFDLVGDLETQRPIIYENPSFSFAAAGGGGYAGQGATPSRTPGRGPGVGSATSASSNGGPAVAPRVASDGTPAAARNLSFHPPHPPPGQQETSGQDRPRSFADIT
ncbi:DNA repair protein rad52, partial [Coemansia nantahalensis]